MTPIGRVLTAAFLFTAGCATSAPARHAKGPPEDDDREVEAARPRPARASAGAPVGIRLVAHVPPAGQYRFVGKVSGEAAGDDLVAAAKIAHDDLLGKAAALGADVVMIDVVSPGDRRTLLAGRAFKAIEPAPED